MLTNLPERITFTGFDAFTDMAGMARISRMYPVEWGVLIGGNPTKNRYPTLERIAELTAFNNFGMTTDRPLRLALHVCGEHSKRAMAEGVLPEGIDMTAFSTVQINAVDYDIAALGRIATDYNIDVIMQVRGSEFPTNLPFRVYPLHDESGGRGVTPMARPISMNGCLVGYAGGIRPTNAVQVVSDIRAEQYWIDMESGIRDDSDRFDLTQCEMVCRKVFSRFGSFAVNQFLHAPGGFESAGKARLILDNWTRQVQTGVYTEDSNEVVIAIMTELFEGR